MKRSLCEFLRFPSLLALLLAFQCTAYSFGEAALVRSELVYGIGSQPFTQSHASTIAQTDSGLVVAWFGGTKEGAPDVAIWLSRYVGSAWSKPIEVANGTMETPRAATVNPVLFHAPQGPLMLFFRTTAGWSYLMRSSDGGMTWSTPERLPRGIVGPAKNKPVFLRDGSIISPTSTESRVEGWRVHFERSTDYGRTWTRTPPANDGLRISAIQPSILVHGERLLQAVGRTKQGRVFSIYSEDNGSSWGEMSLLELMNPNSGVDATTLRDGRHLLVYNHSGLIPNRDPEDPAGYRSPLNVAVSRDGTHWDGALVLESEPRKEFSYPAVIQTRDGLVHITYTYRRESIKHVVIDPSRLQAKPILNGEWPR